jgi:hypothetical protein
LRDGARKQKIQRKAAMPAARQANRSARNVGLLLNSFIEGILT